MNLPFTLPHGDSTQIERLPLMPGNGNKKKKESGLGNFVKSLLNVSPAAVAKIGQEKGAKLKKKKPKPKKKATGNIAKERKVSGDAAARRSFHKFIESELTAQPKTAQERAKRKKERQ